MQKKTSDETYITKPQQPHSSNEAKETITQNHNKNPIQAHMERGKVRQRWRDGINPRVGKGKV